MNEIAEKEWEIVMLPYTKFFNFGESLAAKLDWTQPVTVTEKSDGSLMTIYWYEGKWHVASQGKPDASGKVTCLGVSVCLFFGFTIYFRQQAPRLTDEEYQKLPTYAEVFWKIWNDLGYKLPSEEDRHLCFMFELELEQSIVRLYSA